MVAPEYQVRQFFGIEVSGVVRVIVGVGQWQCSVSLHTGSVLKRVRVNGPAVAAQPCVPSRTYTKHCPAPCTRSPYGVRTRHWKKPTDHTRNTATVSNVHPDTIALVLELATTHQTIVSVLNAIVVMIPDTGSADNDTKDTVSLTGVRESASQAPYPPGARWSLINRAVVEHLEVWPRHLCNTETPPTLGEVGPFVLRTG